MNFFERFTKRPMEIAEGEKSSGGSKILKDGELRFFDGPGGDDQVLKNNVSISETEITVPESVGRKIETIEKTSVVQKENKKEAGVDDVKNIFVEIHNEIVELSKECVEKDVKIKDFVAQIKEFSQKGRAKKVASAKKKIAALSSQADALLEKESQLVDANDAESIQLDNAAKQNTQLVNDGNGELKQLMDTALLARKKERRDAFKRVADMLEALLVDATEIVKSFEATTIKKEHSMKNNDSKEKTVIETIPEIGTVARSNGNFEVLKKVREVVLTTDPVVGEVAVPKIVESKKPEISTVEFDEFLKRPEGSEKIEMIKSLITTEWDDFYQRIFEQAREKNGFVSYGERVRLWNAFFLPQLKEAVTEYLDRHESVHKRDGGRIFRTILRKLEEEFIKNKE